MKKEIFVILDYWALEDCYSDWDYIQHTKGYVFEDYEKAREWVLEWVKDYNRRTKKTERDESGKFVPIDEPVLIEVSKDVWESFDVDIEIFRIGEVDIDSIKPIEKVCLS